ncbi:MAG: DUF5666 domain-containing protein [Acidobacteriota bacterium]
MRAASKVKAGRWITAMMLAVASAVFAGAQTAPHPLGTVKTVAADGLTLTTAAGQEYTVTVGSDTQIVSIPPGSKDLKSATPAVISDVAIGDRVLVTGSATDTGTALNARRIVLMKSAAIAETHEQEEAAWAAGGGGIVKSVDATGGTIVISHGLKPMTVKVTAATQIKKYSPDSVRAQDALAGTLAEIHAGDQLRVRGTKSDDGSSITADAILTGRFRNYSGLITAIDPTAQTITLKDLATKKVVTVKLNENSDVRRIPERMAQMMAMRMHPGTGAGRGAGAGAGRAAGAGAGAPPAGAGGEESDQARAGRTGMDLSQMLSRLPTETLAGLKTSDAVMIVANTPNETTHQSMAITLLAGVEPILQAAPEGEGMTLTPWNVGGDPTGGMPQ